MDFTQWIAELDRALRAAWSEYFVAGLTLAGAAGLLLLLLLLAWAKLSHRPVRPMLVFLGANLGLLLNAEGMWFVLTDPHKADVPKGFAWLVFAVFEIALLIAMDQARSRWYATAVRYRVAELDAEGREHKVGSIRRAGSAGWALAVVWFIAVLSGLIVATNGGSLTTVLLRLGLPVVIVLLWWLTVTAEVATLRRRTTFRWHPYRVGVRRGWWAPEEDSDGSEDRMRVEAAKSAERRLATLGRRITGRVPGRWLWEWRVMRLALDVDEATVDRAAAQVALARDAVARLTGQTRPLRSDDTTPDPSRRRFRLLRGGEPERITPVPDPRPDDVPERITPTGPPEPEMPERDAPQAPPRPPEQPTGAAPVDLGKIDTRRTAAAVSSRPRTVRAPAGPVADARTGGGQGGRSGAPAAERTDPPGRPSADDRAAAVELYRASVEAGEPLSGAALARRFHGSDRWGQGIVKAERVRAADPAPPSVDADPSPNGKVTKP